MWCTHGATGVQETVLYEGSDVRTVNGFVLPRDRGLECASPKYRRRNSVIIIASLREYKRAPAYEMVEGIEKYIICPLFYLISPLLPPLGINRARFSSWHKTRTVKSF